MAENTIRIRRAVLSDYKALRKASSELDMPFSLFMKRSLTQISEKYKNIDIPTESRTINELKVCGVSQKTITEITKICHRLNCDVSTFLKIELYHIQNDYFRKKGY